MAAGETVPLMEPSPGPHERITLRGTILVFFAALAVFSASTLSARSLFPRGVKGRRSSATEETIELLSVGKASPFEDEVLTSLAPVHVTTLECTGDRSLPVLEGADVVAYRTLRTGQPAVHGSEQYSAVHNDYLFYFSSLANKIMFENDPEHYVPAWGGFCSYGIAHEIIWNAESLGPASNPDFWLILNDVLHVFRSSIPMEKFARYTTENVEHGKLVWAGWFGEGNRVTPFDTACFCSLESCVDA